MGDCTKTKEYNCTLCNRTLVSDNCYQGHFSSKICSGYPLCNLCHKPIRVSSTGIRAQHQCYEKKCINCSALISISEKHHCAIKIPTIPFSFGKEADHLYLSIIPAKENKKIKFYYACGFYETSSRNQ